MFLLYLSFSMLHITAAPSLCFSDSPTTVRILGFCTAFAVLDVGVIFVLFQFVVKLCYDYSTILRSIRTTFFSENVSTFIRTLSCSALFRQFSRRMWDKTVKFVIKLLAFAVGATSGHTSIERISQMAIFHLGAYVFALLLSATAFLGFMIYIVYTLDNSALHNDGFKGVNISRGRNFSRSIRKTCYAERRPVEVSSSLSTQPSDSQRALARESRFKRIAILGLCLVYIHSRYVNRYYSAQLNMSASPCFLSDLYNQTPLNFAINLIEPPSGSLHMLLFLLLCTLLWYRIRLHASYRRELFNLNIKLDTGVPVDNLNQFSTNLALPHPVMETNAILASNDRRPMSEISSPQNDRIECAARPSGHTLDMARCMDLIDKGMGSTLSDVELLTLVSRSLVKTRDLEKIVQNPFRAVKLRRATLSEVLTNPLSLENLPFKQYDYRLVYGQCCEEVIGYVPIPVGKVGPLLLDGHSHYIPMATTEGCLVASTNRGCRALFLSGGVKSIVFRDQMTRAPVVRFDSLVQLTECIAWIDSAKGFRTLKSVFEQTSSHINLLSIFPNPAGRYLHIRFAARTGDAMGMNMVSKATDSALYELKRHFPDMQVISLSGNMCTDKKPAVINTLLGRGKSVIAEAVLPATVLAQVLHTNATRMARLGHAKNWTGSALAGCTGVSGSNAHAANLIAALFAATGQDLAQVVDSSACLTQLEVIPEDDSLLASVTMPCLEVGTVGGGTRLPAQRACLDLIDLSVDRPTEHLARLFAGMVLSGELSLLAALDTDDLVTAHLRMNRAKDPVCSVLCTDPIVSEPGAESIMGPTHGHSHSVM